MQNRNCTEISVHKLLCLDLNEFKTFSLKGKKIVDKVHVTHATKKKHKQETNKKNQTKKKEQN